MFEFELVSFGLRHCNEHVNVNLLFVVALTHEDMRLLEVEVLANRWRQKRILSKGLSKEATNSCFAKL